MTKLNSDEPVQLHHVSGDDFQRKVFLPGQEVPDDYIIPDRYLEADEPEGGNEAPEGGGGDDDDDLDEGDDDDAVTEGGEPSESQPADSDQIEIDMEGSVQSILDAVTNLPDDQREVVAKEILIKESQRPAPRSTLLNAMKKLLPS